MIIRAQAFPRVGLMGNPSDGFFGKTIALSFSNYQAKVVLYESPDLEILPSVKDHSRFATLDQLAQDVDHYGYYGGIRLLKASIKRFHDYCHAEDVPLDHRNFTCRYESTIPTSVGLAGSSAIITACFRALMTFYGVEIAPPELVNLILAVETEELHIPAGLQDRVIQVYEGLVYMDFDRHFMAAHGHGRYEPFDSKLLPPLYVAYLCEQGEPTEVVHGSLRQRYASGVAAVVDAMTYWGRLTDRARKAIETCDADKLGELINANYKRRAKVCDLNDKHVALVETARKVAGCAKYTGSGGAIVGICHDATTFRKLQKALRPLNAKVIRPKLMAGRVH
ncbi:MAG: mevalonate kinase family protein [Planctomycetota bacterium]|jgi:glucuronokinase